MRNDDDPVAWWRPGLLLTPRDGLPWLPVSTFFQVSGALLVATSQPEGHGHRYGRHLGAAWAGVLDPGAGQPVTTRTGSPARNAATSSTASP